MNFVRQIFLIATAVLVLTFLPASLAHTQSRKADELNRRVIELYRAGRYAEAIPLVQQALAIYEKALGPDHPDVATAVNNLALLYDKQGRTPRPSRSTSGRWRSDEKALGPDHPDVATVLNNLAVLYDNQGRYAEAEPLYKRALAIDEKALGPDHPDVATALNNLAVLYQRPGPLRRGRAALQARAGDLRRRRSGPIIPMSRPR